MRIRVPALVGCLWSVAYVLAYLGSVQRDGNSPAWWYLALVAAGTMPLIATWAGWFSRPLLLAGAGVLAAAALLGALSVGLLLLPAVLCSLVAALSIRRRRFPGDSVPMP